jgi:hypothetical protein
MFHVEHIILNSDFDSDFNSDFDSDFDLNLEIDLVCSTWNDFCLKLIIP